MGIAIEHFIALASHIRDRKTVTKTELKENDSMYFPETLICLLVNSKKGRIAGNILVFFTHLTPRELAGRGNSSKKWLRRQAGFPTSNVGRQA